MKPQARTYRSFMRSTKIGKILESNRQAFAKAGIRSLKDLRKKLAAGRVESLALGGDDLKVVNSFRSAAKIFPSEIATVLSEHDGSDASSLTGWTEAQFAQALATARIPETEVDMQLKRFARFRKLAKEHNQPDQITGLQVDLGKDYSSLRKYSAEFAAKGIETLADWANLRAEIDVDEQTRKLLDVHARLARFALDPDTVKRLSDEGIDSALALSLLSDEDISKLAKVADIDPLLLTTARHQADQWTITTLNVPSIVPDLEEPLLVEPVCYACADDYSILSKFAYYLYLLDRTAESADFFREHLFQDFPSLTPDDGNRAVSQVSICINVLQSALGRGLNASERLPYNTLYIISILRNVVPRSISQVLSYLRQNPNTDVAPGAPPFFGEPDQEPDPPISPTLSTRLRRAYRAPLPQTEWEMLHPEPAFTGDEIYQLSKAARAILTEEILASPGFAGATTEQVQDEIQRRIQLRPDAGIEDLIRRAALKKAHNLNDRQLFSRYFIETDLPLCEQTTKLDQAIRTLQTYLEMTRFDSPRYLSYATWRGEALAKEFPGTTILLQDDILISASGSNDRGSILRNHVSQYAELTSQLDTVRKAIDEARVDTNSDEDISRNDWNDLTRFTNETSYEYFQRGLAVIDDVLNANDLLYRAADDLDREEPGIALAKLQDAFGLLNQVSQSLFENRSASEQDSSLGYYLARLGEEPRLRKMRLGLSFFFFVRRPKSIFQLQDNTQGLRDLESLQVGDPGWRASSEFEQGDEYIVRNEASTNRHSEFRFDGGADLADYTFSCQFRALSNWDSRPVDSPRVGIGFRQQDGNSGGYRLAVLVSGLLSGDEWLESEVLALQKLDTIGRVSGLVDEEHIGWERRTDIEGSTIRVDHWYDLTVTASGGQLSGSLKITSDKTISLGPVQDSTFDTGTISVFVEGNAEVEFRNFAFRAEPPTGAPPFFAKRRFDLASGSRSILDESDYWMHSGSGESMSLELLGAPLALPIEEYRKTQLWGVKREGDDLYLTFPPGSSKVNFNRLDRLLERCIMLTFYLRYASIPARMSQAYLALGEYKTAADLLHVLYDDEASEPEDRGIYSYFDQSWPTGLVELGADASAMRIRLGEVYLRWAEMLFRQNTEPSRYQARRLYERVLRLHSREDCDCVQNQARAAQQVLALARQTRDPRALASARKILKRDSIISAKKVAKVESWAEALELINSEESKQEERVKSKGTEAQLRRRAMDRVKAAELLMAGAGGTDGFMHASRRLSRVALAQTQNSLLSRAYLCTPENPQVAEQSREACINLQMLKSCVNILGYSDSLVPPLRFETLLRIAQNFANLAQAAERDVMQFRQSFEQETFALMEAQSNLDQANVEVAIERLNVELAEGEIALSNLQQQQAQAGVDRFDALVSEGLTETERDALSAADTAAGLASLNAIINIATSPAQFVASAAAGNPATGAVGAYGNILGGLERAFSARATALTMRASLERQQQDREFQLEQMRYGLAMANQSLALAEQRWTIAQMQEEMAGLRQDFARDAVSFLSNKMLNAAAWLMLMRVAREQYRRRLSYAIETAYLAERALTFELQSSSLKIIRFDYYDPRKDGLLGATQLLTDLAQLENQKVAFRRRKLQLTKTVSLATLVPAAFQSFRMGRGTFAFSTTPEMFDWDFPGHFMRLIQSVRATVVALVPPVDGIHATLRNSGFSQVVIGPPYADQFATRTISRKPESVSLSTPFHASGLFVLDYKDELLLPFEGSGVITDWSFELPKAANQFDFNTIADVLFTIEYTALEGTLEHRSLVRERLGRIIHAERAYSFRHDFADKWYDLHNPELGDDPEKAMVVRFKTLREDFPPNMDQIRAERVALFFAHDGSGFSSVPVRYLNFHDDGNRDEAVSDSDGVVSTSRSAGAGAAPASWRAVMVDQRPVGTWELSFNFGEAAADEAVRRRFREGNIRDILLVITYRGRTSQW